MNARIPPPPYPIHVLPCSIRDAVLEMQQNLQAPDALIAGSFLTAMSIATQGDVDVRLPTGQVRPVSLDILIIADSGERKTATDKLVCSRIYDHDEKMEGQHKADMATHRADSRIWSLIKASIERRISEAVNDPVEMEYLRQDLVEHLEREPHVPKRNRIVHQNITEAPLLKALHGDGNSIAILSDEGEIVLKGGAMDSLGTLNKAWDGAKSLSIDRVKYQYEVLNPRLTVSLMAQERAFVDFMDKRGSRARGVGHLARYLVAWPTSTQGFRYMTLAEHAWSHLKGFHDRVTELLDATHARRAAGDYSRKELGFTQEAKERWVQVQNSIEPRLRETADLSSVRDFASKSMEQASRVAAILHHFSGQEGSLISMETLNRALDIVGWHFDQFIAIFGDRADEPEHVRDTRVLVMYLWRRYWQQGFTAAVRTDVRRSGPVRNQQRFEAALMQLQMQDSVRVFHQDAARGKGRLWIYLNPAVFGPMTM